MLDFLKKLGRAIYACTVGGAVRLIQHTRTAKVDAVDKLFVGRIVTYTAFAVFVWVLPELVVFVAMFRMLTVMDIVGTIANVFQHTANAYAEV